MAKWADFSGHAPGAAPLGAAGFEGVIRYVGEGSLSKRITAMEYQDYSRNSMPVLLVAELGTNDAWSSSNPFADGVARAKDALADARNLGIPDYVGIACAADAHATPAQVASAVEYARGFASILGQARTGFYGFSETSRAVHDANVVGWHWRCGSAPDAVDAQWVNFWQRNDTTVTVGGTVCDINETYATLGEDMTPDQDAALGAVWAYTARKVPKDQQNVKSLQDDLGFIVSQVLAVGAKVDAVNGVLSTTEADIIAAIRAQPTAQVDTAKLAADLRQGLGEEIANDLGRRLLGQTTGGTS